ncbi:hypothetical protein EDD11_000317 [Mortierella claussenii]|nr:hypothetical protein EDD11_000317 [Mortierella claussenii]
MSSDQHAQSSSHLGHPLPDAPDASIPALRQQHLHFQQQQPLDAQHEEEEADIGTVGSAYDLMSIRRAVDLAAHGAISVASMYAFGSAASTVLSQSGHEYTSATTLFMFLVTGVSLLVATFYTGLAWWGRTPRGMDQIRRQLSQHSSSEEGHEKSSPLDPSTKSVRAVVFLASTQSRLWIQAGLMISCFLAGTLQWYKISDASVCAPLIVQYRHFCSTAMTAIWVTHITGAIWMVWLGYCIYWKRRHGRGSGLSLRGTAESDQRGEILNPIPGVPRTGGMQGVTGAFGRVMPVQSSSASQHHNPFQRQPQHHSDPLWTQRPPLGETQQSDSAVGLSKSLGLGIEICTKSFMDLSDLPFTETGNEDINSINATTSNSAIPNSVSACSPINMSDGAGHNELSGVDKHHPQSVSLNDLSQAVALMAASLTAVPGAPARTGRPRSNSVCSFSDKSISSNFSSTRLRDHAHIFAKTRGNAGNIREAYSNRGTPLMHTPARDMAGAPTFPLNRMNSSVPFSPTVMTPTTPLSLGEIGYVGPGTIKALGGARTVSMGYIAAFNSMNANGTNTRESSMPGSAVPSAHGSPLVGLNSFDICPTSGSFKSHRSVSAFFAPGHVAGCYPQTPEEAEAAEQSMDEHLKAVRRRSFTTGADPLQVDPISITDAMFAPGSPASDTTPSKVSSFRSSFSSPILTSYRRRSSLGLKSVLNSIASSPAESDTSSLSSASASSSPCSNKAPCELTSEQNQNDDAPSFEAHRKREQTVSAQELLRAEYGHLYPSQSNSRDVGETHLRLQARIFKATILENTRPRSASVSSASTSNTSSSGCSDSTVISMSPSNLTTLSGEEKRADRVADPPRAFLNRILIGSHHAAAKADLKQPQEPYQNKHQQYQQHILSKNASGGYPFHDGARLSKKIPVS